MEGHVRKRGDKWYYSFDAAPVNGKRKRIERVGGRTKKEAEAALRKAIEEYNSVGTVIDITNMSTSDYFDYWMDNYVKVNCKHNTIIGYEMVVRKHIKPAFGEYRLKALTPAILQEFVNAKYLSGFSKNHLQNITAILSGALKYAVHPCQFINSNPMDPVTLPKYQKEGKSKDAITKKQKLVDSETFNTIISRFPPGNNFYIPIIIGYYTACRISEVMALTWDDIDLDNNIISVNKITYKYNRSWCFGTPKTDTSIREIKFGETLKNALIQHKEFQKRNQEKYGDYYTNQYLVLEEHPYKAEKIRRIYSIHPTLANQNMKKLNLVCTKENGEFVSTDTFKYASRVIHYDLGLEFNFHSLRHTHATTLIENNANIKDVQVRLGHANIQTTLGTYTHQTEKTAQQSVDIFEQSVKNDLPTK